jgi:hypothetical protein
MLSSGAGRDATGLTEHGVSKNPAASAGPVNANQFVHHFRFSRDGGVNALSLSTKIGGDCTSDDTGMLCGSVLVKAEKVAAIVGHENSVVRRRERQNLVIRHGGVRLPGIRRCHHVVPHPPQFDNDL